MGMVVRTNTMALNAYRQLGLNNSAVAKSLEKLASGYRINRAGDDAAGLAISEKMKAQITGLETASANAQDGISLIQTAEGNLSEVHDMLNRMVELSSKSANGTYTSTERKALQDEMDQLLDEIDRISKSANFNGTKLLNGTMGLNNEALSIGQSNGYVAPGDYDITSKIDPLHASNVSTQTEPEFSIDFQDVTYNFNKTANAADVTKATFTFIAGNQSIQLLKADGTAWEDLAIEAAAADTDLEVTGADLANKLVAAKTVKMGDYAYTVSADGDTGVKFTFAGKADVTAGQNTNGVSNNAADNKVPTTVTGLIPQGKVTVAATPNTGTAGAVENRIDCPVYDIKDPVAGADPVRAGATLTLDESMVQDGYTLKIGETTFTFSGSTAAADATGNTIGIKGLSGNDLLQSVTQQLSSKSTTIKKKDATGTEKTYTFNIGRQAGTNILEIEEENPAAGEKVGAFTADELKAAFTLKKKETMANTTLTISDNSKLADKEKLLVDGKEYEFEKGKDLATTMANIKGELGSNYTVTTETASDGKGVVTISATSASANAPTLAGSGLTLQIGDTADEFNKMNVRVADMSAKGLGLESLKKNGIMNEVSASNSIDKIKTAINTVSSTRAGMGALQNRLEHTINNLDVAAENLSAANSRIRDTDMAKEMMNYTKMNVLVQSAQAMLAQANQQPQSVLQLLQ